MKHKNRCKEENDESLLNGNTYSVENTRNDEITTSMKLEVIDDFGDNAPLLELLLWWGKLDFEPSLVLRESRSSLVR